MPITCPNKSSVEWRELVKKVGEQKAYKVFIANNNQVPTLQEIEEIDLKSNEIDYNLKSVSILLSDNAEHIFNKGKNNNWNLNKILTELQVPKLQKQLLLELDVNNREELVLELLNKYNYTVRINVTKNEKAKIPTQYYSNLKVPGGTNYTENEIATPAIIPSIKEHTKFSTVNGIGWFRSDENSTDISTRRIFEIQSDLFQNSRNNKDLIKDDRIKSTENQFLQLLNKNNNWITFFVKSIIQDSIKKGYEKVLFPDGNTANIIQEQETLEGFIKVKENRLKEINTKLKNFNPLKEIRSKEVFKYITNSESLIKGYLPSTGKVEYQFQHSIGIDYLTENQFIEKYRQVYTNDINAEIKQLNRELKNAREGRTEFAVINNFYENQIYNILKKQGYSPIKITDEYNNSWYEVKLSNKSSEIDLSPDYTKELKEALQKDISKDFSIEQHKDVVESLTVSILKRSYQAIQKGEKPSFKKIVDNIKAYYSQPELSQYGIVQRVLSNYDALIKEAKVKLEGLNRINSSNEDVEDGFQDAEFTFEKTWFTEDAIWSNDSKFNSSSRLKSFLFLTQDRELIETEDSFEFKKKINSAGLSTKIVPIDVVFNSLKQILADTEPNFNLLRDKLEEHKYTFPWIQDILDKFDTKGDYRIFRDSPNIDINQIKQEFTTVMTNSYFDFETFLYKTGKDPQSRVIKTNRYSTQQKLLNDWIESFRYSNLVEPIENGYQIREESRNKIVDWYEKNVIKNKDFTPTEQIIRKFLNNFGIELSDQTVDSLLENKPTLHWKTKNGIFRLMYQRLKGEDNSNIQSEFEKFNPLYDNSGITRLAYLESTSESAFQSNSFTDGRGNMRVSVNQQRDFNIRINKLLNNRGFVKNLLNIPFLRSNNQKTWLQQISDNNQEFLSNFKISFVDTLREDKSGYEGLKPTEFSFRQIESTKLIGFDNQGRKTGKFMWMVPGKGALSITTLKEDLKLNPQTGEILDESLNKLYGTVQSEINRILYGNVSIPNYNPNSFYLFPELNTLTTENGILVKDILETREAENAIKQYLKEEFDKINKHKRKVLEQEGLIKEDKFVQIKNKPNKEGEISNVDRFIAEYNFNYMLAHYNLLQTIVGDPALFSKIKDGNISHLSSWDNLSKRLVKDFTSGVRVPVEEGNTEYIQLALKTVERSSKNISGIRERFSETHAYVKTYNKIDITDAAEYITYNERLNNFLQQGLISQPEYDKIKSKLDNNLELSNSDLESINKKGIFGPAKPVQTGRRIVQEGNQIAESVDYVKSAEIVLVPQFTKGFPELDKLRRAMESLEKNTELNPKNLTVRASYDSANKIGGGQPILLENLDRISRENFITSNREGLRYQTEIPYDPKKDKIIDGTQPRKNIELLLDRETKIKYREIYREIYDRNRREFEKNYTINGKVDEQAIERDLLKEARKRGWTEREIKSIQYKNGKFTLPLFLHSSDRIQSLLSSFTNNSVLKNKRKGKSYTAISEEGFEGFSSDMVYTSSYDPKKGLLPSRIEDGEVKPAQIFIPSYFKQSLEKYSKINKEGIITIDSERIPQELFQLFGYRIPNSGYNLMSNFEVVGFLPDYLADTIVVPRDLVSQMGMDFDADKLYIYHPEFEQEDNKLKKSNTIDNDLLDLEIGILKDPKIYDSMVKPISSDNIKSFLSKRYKNQNNRFNFLYDEFYNNRYAESVDAASLIGSFATTVTLMSQLAGNDIYFTTNGKQDNLSLTDLEGNKLSDNNVINSNRLKSEVIEEFLSMALDNDKEPMAGKLNVNQYTAGAVTALILSGFDENTTLSIINHPIVKKYIKEYQKLFEDSGEEIILEYNTEAAINALGREIPSEVNLPSISDIENLKGDTDVDARILSFFMKAQERGKDLSKLKSTINTDSKFLSKSMFDNYLREQYVEELAKLDIANSTDLLGSYMENQLEFPKTIPGFATYYGLMKHNEMWRTHFPFDSYFIRKSLSTIERRNGIKLNDKKKIDIVKGIRQYLYSYATDILLDGKNKREVVSDLINALPKELIKAKNRSSNLFLKLLQIDNKGKIPKIIYNNSAQVGLDESYIYEAFNDLLLNENPILAEKLIKYILLTSPLESPVSYIKFIPIEYLELTGIADKLHDSIEKINNKEFDEYHQGFLLQLLQHKPNLAKRFNPKYVEGKEYSDKELMSFKVGEDDFSKEGIIPFKSYYNRELEHWDLFQYEKDSNLYKRINLLGQGNNFTEYNLYANHRFNSIVSSNNLSVNSKGGDNKLRTNQDRNIPTKVEGNYKFISKYRGKKNLNELLDTIKQNYPDSGILIDLIKETNPQVKFKIDNNLKGRASYSNGVISFNMEKINDGTERQFVEDVLEEVLHSITAPVAKKNYSELNLSEKKYIDGLNGIRSRLNSYFKEDSEHKSDYENYLKKVEKNKLKEGVILTSKERNLFYPILNNQELTAGIFLKKTFQDYLNKKEFKGDKTLAQRIFDLIKDLVASFKKSLSINENTELEAALINTLTIIKSEKKVESIKSIQKARLELNFNDITDSDLDLANIDDIDLSPDVNPDKERTPLSDYISRLQKEIELIHLKKNSAKDKSDRNKFIERIKELEEKVQSFIDAQSITDAVNFANSELDRINEELNEDNVSVDTMSEILRTINVYKDFEELLLDPELARNPIYKDSDLVKGVRELTDRAEHMFTDRVFPIMLNVIHRYANQQANMNVKFEDLFKLDPTGKRVVLKDIGLIQSRFRSLSTTGEPIDGIIQLLIDDANKKADDSMFFEYKNIDEFFDKFTKSQFYKENGYDPFYDEDGNLIKRFTSEYYKMDAELSDKYKNAKTYAERLKRLTEWQKNRLKEGNYVDVRKLYKENEDGSIEKIDNEEYLNLLKKQLGSDNIDYILDIQEKKINNYRDLLISKIEAIEDSGESNDVKQSQLSSWKKTNSPFKMMDGIDEDTFTFKEDNKTFTRNGYYYLYNFPNKNYINPKFDKILANKDAIEFYDFIVSKLNNYYSKAPDRYNEGLTYSFLPYIPMNLIEELNENGVFSSMRHGVKKLFDSVTEKKSPVLFEEVDPITGKKSYNLKYPFSNSANFLTDEELDYQKESRTTDLRKIVKYVAGKTIDYEYKREVESPLKIIEAIHYEAYEVGKSNNSLLLNRDGLDNRRAAVTYAITKQLYGIDPENKYNVKFRTIFSKKEEELKKLLEERLKEEQELLKKKDDERKVLIDGNEPVIEIDKEIRSIEFNIRKYKSSLERFEFNYGRQFSTDSGVKGAIKYTQLIGMGGNVGGAFANLFSAGIGNVIEASGGENFTSKEFLQAFKIMLHSSTNLIPGATIGGILGSLVAPGIGTALGVGLGTMLNSGNFTETGKKINSMMTRLKILGNIIDSRSYEKNFITGEKKWWEKLGPYQLYSMSEYFSQGITMIATMLHKKVEVVDKQGNKKEISLWEAFDNEGEWNTELYKENKEWTEQGREFVNIKRNIEQTRDKVHGNYSTPTPIQGNVFGQAMMQFRRWMIETVANRIESERIDYKFDPEGRKVEGRYRLYFEKNPVTGHYSINMNNVKRVLRQLVFFSSKKTYDDLEPHQMANLRRNVRELQIFISLMAMYYGFKYMSDDDDESYLANVILNSLFRISDDLEFYLNPMSFESMTSQVIPAAKTIRKGVDVLNYSLRIMVDDTPLDPLFRNVSDEKFNVLGRKLMRVTPGSNAALTVNRIVNEAQE